MILLLIRVKGSGNHRPRPRLLQMIKQSPRFITPAPGCSSTIMKPLFAEKICQRKDLNIDCNEDDSLICFVFVANSPFSGTEPADEPDTGARFQNAPPGGRESTEAEQRWLSWLFTKWPVIMRPEEATDSLSWLSSKSLITESLLLFVCC